MLFKRVLLAAVVAVSACSLLATDASAQGVFRAASTQDQEVPPPGVELVETGAFGFSTYRFVGFGRFQILFSSRVSFGLSGPLIPVAGVDSGAHLHNAPAGANGPIVMVFDNDPDIDLGFTQISFDIRTAADLMGPLEDGSLDDLIAVISSGDIYLNEHTAANPSGEIRGQLK